MSHYFERAAIGRSLEDYPLGDSFNSRFRALSIEQLRTLQQERLDKVIARAWQIPFYARRFKAAGANPRDRISIDDLHTLPSFSKEDLMQSIEEYPPFGDFHGVAALDRAREKGPATARQLPECQQVVMQTTSGTTGNPQPLFYGPRDREIQNILLARAYFAQGLTDDDVVHSVYGFGMVNGGHYIRETILHYTRALLLPAGTGTETRSTQQVALMARFGASVLLGFGDYMFRLAEVARDSGLIPGEDIPLRLILGHIDHNRREHLSALWGGASVLDWYGVGDTGVIAAELEQGQGLTVWEDAHLVELLDIESDTPVAQGSTGKICVTCLYKDDVYPIIRFDTQDLSRFDVNPSRHFPALRRIAGFLGRADNMIKLRGINVFPSSIGAHLSHFQECTGEYVCELGRANERDHLTVKVEWSAPSRNAEECARVASWLRQRLGVTVEVTLVAPGATASLTQLEQRQKPLRLIDRRQNA